MEEEGKHAPVAKSVHTSTPPWLGSTASSWFLVESKVQGILSFYRGTRKIGWKGCDEGNGHHEDDRPASNGMSTQ